MCFFHCKKELYNGFVSGAYATCRSRMIIRRLLRSSSQVESTHAENLIRSIGCTDLIAITQAQRNKKEKESRRGRRFGIRDESIGVLISNLRYGSLHDRSDFSLFVCLQQISLPFDAASKRYIVLR